MADTKYVTNQYPFKTYKALLTQTPPLNGFDITDFDNKLIIGEEYTINNYVVGDDFTNVGATANTTGEIFIAVAEIPSNWSNGSNLTSSGNFVVTELENNLGFDVSWVEFNPGIYFAFDDSGPSGNTFPRETTMTYVNQNGGYPVLSPNLILQSQSASFIDVDNIILLSVYDFDIGDYDSGYLFYTPVEINILNMPTQQ